MKVPNRDAFNFFGMYVHASTLTLDGDNLSCA